MVDGRIDAPGVRIVKLPRYGGDLISTGTPPGVGLGQKPPLYLKPGDVVELGIEGLARQRQHVVARS